MDGAGGRGMSPFEVNKLTLAQALYYLKERGSTARPISRFESEKLQKRMTAADKTRVRDMMRERIEYYTRKQ